MSNHYRNCVLQFHQKYNIPVLQPGETVPADRIELRKRLIREEVDELIDAYTNNPADVKAWAKEAADVLYVIEGAKLEFGEDSEFGNYGDYDTNSIGLILGSISSYSDMISKPNSAKTMNIWMDGLTCELETFLHKTGLVWYFQKVFDAVQASNMSKGTNGKPVYDNGGKLLKGEDYRQADLSFLDAVKL